MRSNLIQFFLILCLVNLSTSCGRKECKNADPILDKYSPDAKEYKSELTKQIELADAGELRYWFIRYFERDGKDFIEIEIQGGKICAKAEVLVEEWGNLSAIKKTLGVGYSGAELKGFEMMMVKDSVTTNLMYVNADKIVD